MLWKKRLKLFSANALDAMISNLATLNGESDLDARYTDIDVDNVNNVSDSGLSSKTDCMVVASVVASDCSRSLTDVDVDAGVDVGIVDISSPLYAYTAHTPLIKYLQT